MESIFDELEIKSLIVRERFYRDTCQWEKFRQAYHFDETKTAISVSWFTGDIVKFVKESERMAQTGTRSSHTVSPIEVHINGTKAVSDAKGTITVRFDEKGKLYDCVSVARFISRLEKTESGWRLLTLHCIYERDSIVPVLPSASEISFQGNEFRESYRCLSWVLSKAGHTINQDLPGIEKPETVRAMMDSTFSWLKQS